MHLDTPNQLRALAPNVSRRALQLPTVTLFGLEVANTTMATALDWLSERLDLGERTRVAFLNAHCVNLAAKQPEYRQALAEADAILPDGSGVALAARLKRTPLAANLNGTDLVPALCRRLAASGRSVFLLGGRPGIAEGAAQALVEACPGLRVAGTRHGYFAPEEEDRVVAEVGASGADVVLVAFGVPAQDTWLHRVRPRLSAPLTLGVGGLFDFLSGRIPRAPASLRRLGLEWTYRLYQEPRRMWRRYILGNPAFAARAVFDARPDLAPLGRRIDLALKRSIDIGGAALGLMVLAPLFLVVAAAIRATSPGPAFLRQIRAGQNGKTFALYKFRSMYADAAARQKDLAALNQHGPDGVTFKLRHDPRVTPAGRWLRRSSIDELPQLWNVLIGEMSLVGPRPPLPAEVERYRPFERRRLEAKPGLTCLWQIGGRANLPFETQVALDIEYQQRRNTLLDLLILLRTVPAVLTARGAYQDSSPRLRTRFELFQAARGFPKTGSPIPARCIRSRETLAVCLYAT